MNTETIICLIDDVARAVATGERHLVYQTCNVLIKQLDRVNVDNIASPKKAADFINGKEAIRLYSKQGR